MRRLATVICAVLVASAAGAVPEVTVAFTLANDSWTECACCDAPLNPEPVRIGNFMDMAYGGVYTSYNHEIREAYEWFFTWLHRQRGGICLGGQRRPVELLMVDNGSGNKSEEAVRNLVFDRNISLLLGPASSAEVAPAVSLINSSGAVYLASSSNAKRGFVGNPRMFGMLSPSEMEMESSIVALAGKVSRVATIEEDQPYASGVCQGARDHAQLHSMAVVAQIKVPFVESRSNLSGSFLPGLSSLQEAQPDVVVGCVVDLHSCLALVQAMKALTFDVQALITNQCLEIDGFISALADDSRFLTSSISWSNDVTIFRSDAMDASVSEDPPLLSSEWAQRFSAIYHKLPSYFAPYAWSAALALVTAIETANTTEPGSVAAALRNMTLDTIIGHVAFDENGQNKGGFEIIQIQSDSDLHPQDVTHEGLFFPMPVWNDRECYLEYPYGSVYGYDFIDNTSDDLVCGECQDEFVAVFNDTSQRRECEECLGAIVETDSPPVKQRICRAACPVGRNEQGVPCTPGFFGKGCECKPCQAGSFTKLSGAGECQACPGGRYAGEVGSTICSKCGTGRFGPGSASVCSTCPMGHFAAEVGTSACALCPAGYVATGYGSTTCEFCDIGKYAVHGQANCSLCPVGKYGCMTDSSDKCPECKEAGLPTKGGPVSTCCDGSIGGVFEEEGIIRAPNRESFWLRETEETIAWERCLGTIGSCMQNETCALGSTGVHCAACLPGYASNPRRGMTACFECPAFTWNIIATALVLSANVFLVLLVLIFVGGYHSRKGLDMRLACFRTAILQFFIVTFLMDVVSEVVQGMEAYVDPGVREVLYALCFLFSSMPGFSFLSESVLWSVHCLVQPAHPEGLFDALATLRHGQWFKPETLPWKTMLNEFQLEVEFRLLGFWMLWPVAVLVATYVVCMVYVFGNVFTWRGLYSKAEAYHEALTEKGPEEAVGDNSVETLIELQSVYPSRILNLWLPRWFVSPTGLRNCCRMVLNFNAGAKPLPLAVAFICYGAVLLGVSRPLRCRDFGGISGPWAPTAGERLTLVAVANTIVCGDHGAEGSLGQWANILFCAWGLGVPLVTAIASLPCCRLRTRDEHIPWCAVATMGYRRSCYLWEVVVFTLKLGIIASSITPSDGFRRFLNIILSSLFCVISLTVSPFDRNAHSMANRINFRLTSFWVYEAFIIANIWDVVLTEESEFFDPGYGWPAAIVILLCITHLVFLVSDAWHLTNQIADAAVAGSYRGVLGMVESSAGCVKRWLFRRAQKWHRNRAYVSFSPEVGWITICGNRADLAEVPEVLDPFDLEEDGHDVPDLSDAPWMPDGVHVRKANRRSRMRVQKALLAVQQHLATLPGSPLFSVSLLEFSFRAIFIVAKRLEEHENVVHRTLDVQLFKQKTAEEEEVDVDELAEDIVDQTFSRSEGEGIGGRDRNSALKRVDTAALHFATACFETEVSRKSLKAGGSQSMHITQVGGVWYEVLRAIKASKGKFTNFFKAVEDIRGSPTWKTMAKAHNMVMGATGSDPNEPLSAHMKRVVDRYVQDMMDPSLFSHGIELSIFCEAAAELQLTPEPQMRLWLDLFEVAWTKHNKTALATVKGFARKVHDAGANVKVDRDGILIDTSEDGEAPRRSVTFMDASPSNPSLQRGASGTMSPRRAAGSTSPARGKRASFQARFVEYLSSEGTEPDSPASRSSRNSRASKRKARLSRSNTAQETGENKVSIFALPMPEVQDYASEEDDALVPVKESEHQSRGIQSWVRLIVLSQSGFPGDNSAMNRPSLGEARQLLQEREDNLLEGLRKQLEEEKRRWHEETEKRKEIEEKVRLLKHDQDLLGDAAPEGEYT